MKRLIAVILTACTLLSLPCALYSAANNYSLVLQDLSYDEIPNRVSQGDCGFTVSSTAIYAHHLDESSEPRNDSGFQFYYISLSGYSGSFEGREDKPLDDWFIEYLDASLANLRANGGGCMVRATYGLDGQQKCEPTDFNILLEHVRQLSLLFSEYTDVISTVECGMIGAFGEMWGGLYSDSKSKAAVLDAWLTYLPEEISVNVRTAGEYMYYINNSDTFLNNYKSKTVNGITYPDRLNENNYWMYTFPGERFGRIGIYNDAMIQDGADGGTFPYADYDLPRAQIQRKGAFTFLANQSENANYGGEFSGNKGIYRWKVPTWMPLNAMSEFYKGRLSYYHGGNNAYRVTGKYHGEYVDTYYYNIDTANARLSVLKENVETVGSGMSYSVITDENDAKVYYPDRTYSEKMTYAEALETAAEYNATSTEGTAQAHIKTVITTGGWSSATVGDALIERIAQDNAVTADLDDYKGQSVAKFFEDHVGYRMVLRESYISESACAGSTLRIRGTVDNTGFANITKDKVTELVLTNDTNTYVLPTNINARSWKSAQRSTYADTVTLPADIAPGEYSVYMRVANKDNAGNTVAASAIAFANSGKYTYTTPASTYNVGTETFASCYDSTVHGNYIGKVTVTEFVPGVPSHVTVTFMDGDRVLESVSVPYAESAEHAVTPQRPTESFTKYTFERWVDESGNGVDLSMVTEDMTVYASYYEECEHPFTDLEADRFYTEAVEWALMNGVMNGTSDTLFSPDTVTNRAMIVTVLYRLQGAPATDAGEAPFTDVVRDSYYEDAVLWAYGTGVVNGTTESTFSPTDPLTREQFAAILWRYAAQIEGKDVSVATGASLDIYADYKEVSEYAKVPLLWASENGLITGTTPTTLSPKSGTTRAQTATILYRYMSVFS